MAVATKDDSTDDSDNEMEIDSFQDVDAIDQNVSTELLNLSISEGDSHDVLINELKQLMPSVVKELSSVQQHDNLLKFFRLVANGQFPSQNIGFLLFMDIVKWYATDETSEMRYSSEVKRFWRVGMKLFKGKCLRFMSGLKNKGQVSNSIYVPGKCRSSDSKVNFAVPSRQILDGMKAPVDASKPGILTDMIDTISESDPKQLNTYKLCVDGNNINSGIYNQKPCDINMWGNETLPTLNEREIELRDEICTIEQLQEYVDKLHLRDLKFLNDMLSHLSVDLLALMQRCIQVLSNRISGLRTLKVGQSMTLEKLKFQVSGDCRTSRLGYTISAIKSRICEIYSAILDLLRVVDDLCYSYSCQNEVGTYVKSSTYIDLGHQYNFVCLQGIKELKITDYISDKEVLSVFQQRSNTWFAVRKQAIMNGRTFYRGLGLDGLKKQKQHFDNFLEKRGRGE